MTQSGIKPRCLGLCQRTEEILGYEGDGVLYTLPVKINGYVSFLINTWDTIVDGWFMLAVFDSGGYSVEATWCGCREISAFMSHGWSSLNLSGPSSQAYLGKIWFIIWRLRCLFLGECQRGPRHFYSHRAFLGNDPRPGPNFKIAFLLTK